MAAEIIRSIKSPLINLYKEKFCACSLIYDVAERRNDNSMLTFVFNALLYLSHIT